VISTPPVKVLFDKYPDLCPKQRQAPEAQSTALQVGLRGQAGGRIYKVEKGDTLFDIARDELGKASRWAEIYELNRDTIGNDVDRLSPGMELRLPGDRESPSRDPLTTQSRQPYNR
jgi:nucleoid-associated protein YgaU